MDPAVLEALVVPEEIQDLLDARVTQDLPVLAVLEEVDTTAVNQEVLVLQAHLVLLDTPPVYLIVIQEMVSMAPQVLRVSSP